MLGRFKLLYWINTPDDLTVRPMEMDRGTKRQAVKRQRHKEKRQTRQEFLDSLEEIHEEGEWDAPSKRTEQ